MIWCHGLEEDTMLFIQYLPATGLLIRPILRTYELRPETMLLTIRPANASHFSDLSTLRESQRTLNPNQPPIQNQPIL